MNKSFVIIVIFCVLIVPKLSFSANRVAHADFEGSYNDGDDFNYSGSGFSQTFSCRGDWEIESTDPYAGSFCGKSKNPNNTCTNTNNTESQFEITFNGQGDWAGDLSFGDELFVRFYAKFPTDWTSEAGGVAAYDNTFRLNDLDNNHSYEADMNRGWGYWYDTGFVNASIFIRDNSWHQYVIYIKMPTSSSSADGILRLFVDQTSYTSGNASYNWTNIDQNDDFETGLLVPMYYKGEVTGNWTYYVDNVEVWDGIPGEETDTAAKLMVQQATNGVSIEFSTNALAVE